MKKKRKFMCMCCEKYVMEEHTPGSLAVCPNCGWIDDEAQFNDFLLSGGANRLCLKEYRENYLNKLESENPELRPHSELCTHFGRCGGCSLQNLRYEAQIKHKKEKILNLLGKYINADDAGSLNTIFEGIISAPDEFGYRNKMEFSFGDEKKGGELTLGFHRKGSFHDILDLQECLIVNADCVKIMRATVGYARSYGCTHENKTTHEGYLRYLVLRTGNCDGGMIMVNLVTSSEFSCSNEKMKADEDDFLSGYVSMLNKMELKMKIVSIMHTVSDSISDAVKCDKIDTLYGSPYIMNELCGLKFKVSPFSFFQTNTQGAELLYGKVKEYAGDVKERVIYDLYSGTGTIAQIISSVAKKTVGVEIVAEAVEAARENAAMNGLNNCEFIVGDVFKTLDSITVKPDIIILDPPREGINPKALPHIISYGVERIVYVSCKPESLARDLETFTENGYKAAKMCCVDLFPQTEHVETVVLMSRVKE